MWLLALLPVLALAVVLMRPKTQERPVPIRVRTRREEDRRGR